MVTFDETLYMKAVEMVAAAGKDGLLSKVVVRLGGFHLMSFMGAVGNIKSGSGLEELWPFVGEQFTLSRLITLQQTTCDQNVKRQLMISK
ncbi:hypothetical protein Pmani_009677 [Petrolisthes manimaculis]|uniref:Uncharacterized protein n=1 Tax=Petrolisthes manimaculis TaxID=1843537 RepID=A0AAE1Q4I7_9EUCA|nr:hypothetical protein Pmani_009677 [Petrolisthes manimaculis]